MSLPEHPITVTVLKANQGIESAESQQFIDEYRQPTNCTGAHLHDLDSALTDLQA